MAGLNESRDQPLQKEQGDLVLLSYVRKEGTGALTVQECSEEKGMQAYRGDSSLRASVTEQGGTLA